MKTKIFKALLLIVFIVGIFYACKLMLHILAELGGPIWYAIGWVFVLYIATAFIRGLLHD